MASEDAGEKLRRAVLELSAARPVTSISVVELCAAAGVVRDTFYRYGDRPAAVLAGALRREIDDLPGAQDAAQNVMAAPTVAILEHVRSRRAIYRNAMEPHFIVPIREVLTTWVEQLLEAYLDRNPDVAPRVAGALPPAAVNGMFVAYAASGAVGAIERFVASESDDVEQAAAIVTAASAPWWFVAPEQR